MVTSTVFYWLKDKDGCMKCGQNKDDILFRVHVYLGAGFDGKVNEILNLCVSCCKKYIPNIEMLHVFNSIHHRDVRPEVNVRELPVRITE